jgi:hypothetical protein
VALRTLHLRVLPEQRVGGLLVVGQRELGWLPTGFDVAGFAIAAIGPARQLSPVLVNMAIQTSLEGNMRFEILALVAALAFHSGVLTKQRIVGPAMVESIAWKDLLPAIRGVTPDAIDAKGAAVRIFMARPAGVELHKVLILDDRSRARLNGPVALLATHRGVQAGQRIT